MLVPSVGAYVDVVPPVTKSVPPLTPTCANACAAVSQSDEVGRSASIAPSVRVCPPVPAESKLPDRIPLVLKFPVAEIVPEAVILAAPSVPVTVKPAIVGADTRTTLPEPDVPITETVAGLPAVTNGIPDAEALKS